MSENVQTAPIPAEEQQTKATISSTKRSVSKGRGRTRSRKQVATPVLGVHVTLQNIYAVLMRPTSNGYEPIRQFSRQRSGGLDVAPDLSPLADETPESVSSDDGVTIRFGGDEAPAGVDLFLESEFSALGIENEVALDAVSTSSPKHTSTPIVFELKDIIEECQTAGFEKPALAFVIGVPDVDYVEVVVPAESSKAEKKAKSDKKGKKDTATSKKKKEDAKQSPPTKTAVKRERLISLLPPSEVLYNKERVAFIPMTPRDGQQRYLAVLPRPEEPVVDSLQLLREQQGMRRIPFRDIDAEVPVLMGMARMAFPTEASENTAIVRVGTEDTLVILLQGDELHHCDHMRSVTTFDGPDTICSRVLLQQDVQGVGTVHNVIIVSEEREEELVQGFAAFYPEARVETLREGLSMMGISGPYGPMPTPSLGATGIALKTLMRREGAFEDVNLLPKQLRKRAKKFELTFAWHTIVAGVLLFLSVLFFVGLFFTQSSEISQAEQRLAEFPVEATMTGSQLQMRIDSLRMVQQRINTSLVVLDSLLYGTDQWSQTLAVVNRATSGVGNAWIEEWQPGAQEVSVQGFATTRNHVVDLASRLSASIDELTFDEIREFPVYSYRMRFALPNELPAAARYLRERAGEALPPPQVLSEPLADSVPLTQEEAAPSGPPAETSAPTQPAPVQ
ncbi:MAG: hypothetical protein R3284_07345 [Rubricoccaceae bacterium]|nr:hypothetical protein [Rubricoccaceae bacterium]